MDSLCPSLATIDVLKVEELQIHLCTCSSGSASTTGVSRKRAATAFCKSCGGKPFVDGQGSSPHSMLSTVGLELSSLINSGLTWKSISKGNRSASRRARKSVAKSSEVKSEHLQDNLEGLDMPLGVTLLGCRFSEKAEHVPIKKRRFLFRSPSPPRRTLPPRREDAARLLTGKRSSRHMDSVMSCKHVALGASASASAVDMGQIVDMDSDVGRKDLLGINRRLGDGEDFSGISILAAAACSSSMEEDVGCVEEGHKLGDSFSNSGPHEVLTNDESCSLSKALPKGDFVNSAETSNQGTSSCVSTIPGEELVTSGVNNSRGILPQNDMDLQDSAVVVSPVCLGERDGRAARRDELSLRDERLHWDLNTEMDAWEHPFSGYVDSEKNVADGTTAGAKIVQGDDKKERGEGHETLKESGDTICDTENLQLSVGMRTLETQEFEEGKFEAHGCSNNDASLGAAICDSADNPVEPSTSVAADKDAVNMDVITVSSGTPEACSSDQNAGKGSFSSSSGDFLAETCIDNGNCGTTLIKDADKCVVAQLEETEKQDASLQLKAFSEVTCVTENLQIKDDTLIQVGDGKGFSTIFTECHNGNASGTEMVLEEDNRSSSPAPTDAVIEHLILNSDGTQIQQSPPLCKDQPAPGPLVVDESTIVLDKVIEDPGVSVQETDAEAAADMHDDSVEPIEKPNENDTKLLDAPCEHSSQDALKYTDINDSDRVDLRGPFEDNHSLGVSQDGASVLAGSKEMTEIQDGYDSPYEDGEVRESIHHTWDYYDVEDGEAEQVDYGSDNKELYGFDASIGHFSRVVKEHPKQQSVDIKDVDSEADNFVKSSQTYLRVQLPLKDDTAEFANTYVGNANMVRDEVDAKASSWGRLQGVRKCSSDTDGDLRDGASRKILGREGSELVVNENGDRLTGSRPCRRGSLSRIEGPECDDAILKKQNHFIMRRSSDPDSKDSLVKWESMSGKSETVRYAMHNHKRGHKDDQRPNSSEGNRRPKNHRLPTFSGQEAFLRPGPENDSTATVAKLEDHGLVTSERAIVKGSSLGPTSRAVRQNENSLSSSVRRPFRRSGSPAERDEAFGKHSSLRSSEEMSVDRFAIVARSRATKYSSRVNNQGLRGRYHGQVGDESIEASFNRPHFVPRRDRSFSPTDRKGDPQLPRSHSTSPSLSRSRSPILWSFPRRRNGPSFCGNPYVRHRSRSPNFRPEAKMRRMRSPHHRTGFFPGHGASFVSMQRSRGSPPYDPGWIDDRKDGVVQFRGHGYKPRYPVLNRRSPGRVCSRSERFDLVDSPRKMKLNESYRSMHPGRYSDMVGLGRGTRYEETEDDRKRNEFRYGLPPVRRYDMYGAVKRIRYNTEDDFVPTQNSHNKEVSDFQGRGSPKAYNRGLDGRLGDFQRRSRDEKGPGFYRRDGKYSNSDRSFGNRELDEDVAARRRRPS
ncbi:hypothetical protein RJ641_035575 [Dillenia turbinata]|uniref:Uncharacterized protein n=1 Tax=Dillenia turbinata TaxID=194707 RepID=A0AAN8VJV4_9MAGN